MNEFLIKIKSKLRVLKFDTYSCLVFIGIIIVSIIGYWFNNVRLSHMVIEIFCVVVAYIIGTIAFNTYHLSKNSYFTFLGVSYLFTGSFFLLHAVSFNGMGLLLGDYKRLTYYMSFTAELVEAVSLLIVICIINRAKSDNKKEINPNMVFNIYFLLSITYVGSLLSGKINEKVCDFFWFFMQEKINEFFIVVILVPVLVLLIKNKDKLQNIYIMLLLATLFKMLSQFSLLFSTNTSDMYNLIGHVLRLLSFSYMYKALVSTTIKTPFLTLFEDLNIANSKLKVKATELETINDRLWNEINERKRIEEALIRSEEDYQRLIELIPDGVFVSSEEKVIFSNPAGAKLLGLQNPEDLIGKKVFEQFQTDYDESYYLTNNMMKEDKDVRLFEGKTVRSDGSYLDVEILSIPFSHKIYLEEHTLFLSVVRDISERKRTIELNKHIEEKNRLLKEAAELDRMKDEFFSNISHEFRTPINLILCTLQLFETNLNEDIQTLDGDRIKKQVSIMKQNCYRLIRLVDNLIDITKIDTGLYALQLKNYNIVNIVENITEMVVEHAKNKNIEVSFDTDVEEKIIACDPDKIERIMLNLFSNAVKFTKHGGKIEVDIHDNFRSIIISVKDTGVGIAKDKMELIFERFKQAEKLYTRQSEGSGLGLSITKSLVELHGGKIEIESEVNKGSNFIIELPANIVYEEDLSVKCMSKKQACSNEKIDIEFSDIYY